MLYKYSEVNKISYSDELADFYSNNLLKDNEELKRVLELNKTQKFRFINSTIIDRSILYNTITIDKGSDDGIEINDTVLNSKYLIGYVSFVSNNYSEVTLLLNEFSNIRVPVIVGGEIGVSYFSDKYNSIIVTGINDLSKIKKGTKIYTKLSSYLIDGVFVGTVSGFLKDENGIKRIIEIKRDNYEYNYVSVIDK